MIILKAMKDLDYWKKKLLAVLNKAPMEKSLKDVLFPGIMLKSLPAKTQDLLIKARGYAVGTIREWSGKKYKKLSSGKWMRTYTGTKDRGEQQAIRNVMSKIQKASSMEELASIVSQNMQRFKDESGKTLPIVKDFMGAARGTESGKKEHKKPSKVVVHKKPVSNEEIGAKAKLDNQKRIAEEFDVPLKTVQDISDKYKKDFPRRKPNIDTIRNLVKESIVKDTDKISEKLKVAKKEMADLKKPKETPEEMRFKRVLRAKLEKKLGFSKQKVEDQMNSYDDQIITNMVKENMTPDDIIDEIKAERGYETASASDKPSDSKNKVSDIDKDTVKKVTAKIDNQINSYDVEKVVKKYRDIKKQADKDGIDVWNIEDILDSADTAIAQLNKKNIKKSQKIIIRRN